MATAIGSTSDEVMCMCAHCQVEDGASLMMADHFRAKSRVLPRFAFTLAIGRTLGLKGAPEGLTPGGKP
jgi:hypothetical protein